MFPGPLHCPPLDHHIGATTIRVAARRAARAYGSDLYFSRRAGLATDRAHSCAVAHARPGWAALAARPGYGTSRCSGRSSRLHGRGMCPNGTQPSGVSVIRSFAFRP
jgi:hypothetical protein